MTTDRKLTLRLTAFLNAQGLGSLVQTESIAKACLDSHQSEGWRVAYWFMAEDYVPAKYYEGDAYFEGHAEIWIQNFKALILDPNGGMKFRETVRAATTITDKEIKSFKKKGRKK